MLWSRLGQGDGRLVGISELEDSETWWMVIGDLPLSSNGDTYIATLSLLVICRKREHIKKGGMYAILAFLDLPNNAASQREEIAGGEGRQDGGAA